MVADLVCWPPSPRSYRIVTLPATCTTRTLINVSLADCSSCWPPPRWSPDAARAETATADTATISRAPLGLGRTRDMPFSAGLARGPPRYAPWRAR